MGQAPRDQPTDAAIAERSQSFANEAMHMIALQHRRIRSTEPEDEVFVFRFWADLQFFIISLRRLHRAAARAATPNSSRSTVGDAIRQFERALPDLRRMRNVGEHLDDYAMDRGNDRQIGRRDLQVGSFDGSTYRWLGGALNIDEALRAAEDLHNAVAKATVPPRNA
jgi:hypothetical protein